MCVNINKALIWESDVSNADWDRWDEETQRWYVGRVLAWGGRADILQLGLETVRRHLPHISLTPAVREFWEWYFTEGERHVDP